MDTPVASGNEVNLPREDRTSLAMQLLSEIALTARSLSLRPVSFRAAHKLTPGTVALLQAISAAGQLSVPEIARLQSVSRQNVQVIINRLVASQYVDGLSNLAHKRSPLFRLTAAGQRILTEHKAAEEPWQTNLVENLDAAELQAALAALSRIRQSLVNETKGPFAKSQMPAKFKPRIREKVRRPSSTTDSPSTPPVPTLRDSTSSESDEFPFNLL